MKDKIKNTKVLGMPLIYALCVITVLVIGIIIGSFCDFNINQAVANKTKIGELFANYGSCLSYCLYPAAGMCIYKGLIKKDNKNKFLAWTILVVAYFLAVYYTNSYSGTKLRTLLGYDATNPNFGLDILCYFIWIVIYSWVPVVFYFFLDDAKPTLLIGIGIAILVAGITADCVNLWLKQVASRPRYKYLITLEDPASEFRNWWEWKPYLAGSNDNFKSWPSGNMTIACMMFALPMLTSVIKKSNKLVNIIAFAFACLFVALYGYNRMHMTNHFLSDVCFGTLITYIIFIVISYAFVHKVE